VSEENKALARRVFEEIISQGNLAAVDEIFAENFVNQPFGATGRAGARSLITILRTAFPDIKATVEEQIAEQDKVVTRATLRGTHEGPTTLFGNLPPTGKPVTVSDIVIHRFEGGKIVEGYAMLDLMGMLQQIGALPTNR
jgi:steroid delta-isomerase-like uncharacterized protein